MSEKSSFQLGIVFIGIVLIFLAFLFWRALYPPMSLISAKQAQILPVESSILEKSKVADQIQKQQKFGNVPVVVPQAEEGRDDPFAKY